MRILIVGAGIGGCALGWALRQLGFEVILFERSSTIAEVGAGLSLWSNATRALQRLGLGHLVEHLSVPMVDGGLYSHRGKRISQNPVQLLNERYGAPNIIAHRAELLDGLLQAVGTENVRLGAQCAAVSQEGDKVRLALTSGEEIEGDLLIGADGLRSVVRKSMGLPLKLRYAGYTGYRGIMDLAASGLSFDDEFWGGYIGQGRQFGVMPITNGRTYWFMTENTPAGQQTAGGGHGAYLLEKLQDWAEPVVKIIGNTPEQAILRHDIFDQKPLSKWCLGRIALLGDAAHATTPNMGQGACMALEDALVLSLCLDQGRDNPEAALQRYQDIRLQRANKVVKYSWWTGKVLQLENPVLCYMRNVLLSMQSPKRTTEQLSWLLSEPFDVT